MAAPETGRAKVLNYFGGKLKKLQAYEYEFEKL